MAHSSEENSKDTRPIFDSRSEELNRMLNQGKSWCGRQRNTIYLNLGAKLFANGAQFANVSGVTGLDFADDARAIAALDWDNDGDQDLWIRIATLPNSVS